METLDKIEICTVTKNKTALILSAHAADFVWRCGGAIALHQKLGYQITILVCHLERRGQKRGKRNDFKKVKDNRKGDRKSSQSIKCP